MSRPAERDTMYSKTIIVGRAGRDAEQRFTPAGKAVTQFSVAVDIGWGDNKKTQWYEVVCWDKLAEVAAQYVKKGSKVLCDGVAELNEYTGKDGTSKASLRLTAREVKFLSDKSETGTGNAAPFVDDDDLPF
jgi:single-strand DNA-binding protein